MNSPRLLTIADVRTLPVESTVIWVTPSVKNRVIAFFPFACADALVMLSAKTLNLVVVGGGGLIDEAKVWRMENAPHVNLIAIPSIWGSGAEVSPIAVLNRSNGKNIYKNKRLLPDGYAYWLALVESIPVLKAKFACGDVWAHVLEGILSPLAGEDVRINLAKLINLMMKMPLGYDPRWFECSSTACMWQSRAGVGLVHGIAHTLERVMNSGESHGQWGHARLCSLFLWPVMRYNDKASSKFREVLGLYNIEPERIMQITKSLFDKQAYELAMPAISEMWSMIIRDPCSRMNSALVRSSGVEYFANQCFYE